MRDACEKGGIWYIVVPTSADKSVWAAKRWEEGSHERGEVEKLTERRHRVTAST